MLVPKRTDAHCHLGQFFDIYTSPKYLLDFLDSVGIEDFAVSSTSTCEENYNKVISEITSLLGIAGDRVVPVLWITPEMIRSWTVFSMFDKGIEWRCLKIHPQLHPVEWLKGSPYMHLVAAIASIKRLPLLIHTGEMQGCFPKDHEWIIASRPDVTFILAHGRPIDQTLDLMKRFENVWCDTAFMPTENVVKLCREGLTDRILWGTDYPIPKYHYPDADMKQYYSEQVNALGTQVDKDSFNKITEHNFHKLFLRHAGI